MPVQVPSTASAANSASAATSVHSALIPGASTLMSSNTLTPQRKHHKLLKDGSGEEVWPASVEAVFVQGLKSYWDSPWATYSRGRSRWRNQFLVDYLRSAGIVRTKKQVASHIQVLRNMWKGEPEFYLVAGSDGSSSASGSGASSTRLKSCSKSKSRSPPPVKSEDVTDASVSFPPLSNPRITDSLSYKFDISPASSTHSSPQPAHSSPSFSPYHSYSSLATNTISHLTISAPGLTPVTVPTDPALLIAAVPVFHFRLQLPSHADFLCPSTVDGFAVQLSMTQPWAQCRTMTRVFAGSTCVSQENASVLAPSSYSPDAHSFGSFPLLLPESALSNCRWLPFGAMLRFSQQITVDNVPVAYVLYDFDQQMVSIPSMEFVKLQYRALQSPNTAYQHHSPPAAPHTNMAYSSCGGYGVPPVSSLVPTSVTF